MLPAYEIFKNEIEQIEKYMQSIEFYNQIVTLDVSKSRAIYKDKIINLQKCNDGFYKRKYDYAIVIISLYGGFEQFVENFIRDYLMILIGEYKEYSKLPELIRNKHFDLSVLLLGKIDQPKYSGIISKEQIIRNLNECIQNNKCALNYEAFCQHTANFRSQVVGEVLGNIGLSKILNNIKRNEALKLLYIQENGECSYDNLELDKVFSFLSDLANRRNQIAHGAIEDILSYELQKQMIEKVKLFVCEMDKIGFEMVLCYLINKSYKIERIYNPNKKTKLLCFNFTGKEISIGDIIIKKNNDKFTYCRIKSIEINRVQYEKYETQEDVDVEAMLDTNRKEGEEYWIYSVISS